MKNSNDELMYAVLSMAAYEKVPNNLNKSGSGSIGEASVVPGSPSTEPDGFAAVTYTYNGQTVIAYRGTDNPSLLDFIGSDIWHGWTAGDFGGYLGILNSQTRDAAQYYKDIAGSEFPYNKDVVFTGHSLGGGLAGLMASLYGKTAVVFDNMGFKDSANNVYNNANNPPPQYFAHLLPDGTYYYEPNPAYQDYLTTKETFYGNSAPQTPNFSGVSGYQELGQILGPVLANQSMGEIIGQGVQWGIVSNIAPGLHSMSLLVLDLYAKFYVNDKEWKQISDKFGPKLFDLVADTAIAYSVVQSGNTPYGDSAARLFFDDMNDAGRMLVKNVDSLLQPSLNNGGTNTPNIIGDLIADLIVRYDLSLANKAVKWSTIESKTGFLYSGAGFEAIALDGGAVAVPDAVAKLDMERITSTLGDLVANVVENLGKDAKDAITAAKLAVFADGGKADAADALTHFADGYQIKDIAHAGAVVIGTTGNDDLAGTQNVDVLVGGAGGDTLEGGGGADFLFGGDGSDTASYEHAKEKVTINLTTQTYDGADAKGDQLFGIENVIGTQFNDTLVGNDEANVLTGLDGTNVLVGGKGIDTLNGGKDSDILITGGLDDTAGSSTGRIDVAFNDNRNILRTAA